MAFVKEEYVDTKVFEEEFKGHKMFAVYGVDKDGNKCTKYPLVSLGSKKVSLLIKHQKELLSWEKMISK